MSDPSIIKGFSPHSGGIAIPPKVPQQFQSIVAGIYPQEIIDRLRSDGQYQPVIIGYDHENTLQMASMNVVGEIMLAGRGLIEPPTVGLEIMPQQLGWVRDFLTDEQIHRQTGLVNGQRPSPETLAKLKGFRRELVRSVSSAVALTLLQWSRPLLALEHPSAWDWITHDRNHPLIPEEEAFSGSRWDVIQPGYTAIRRDSHWLQVIERERPGVIAVGTFHALKLDLLLERDGSHSRYQFQNGFSWPRLLAMWSEVHALHRRLTAAAV